MKTCPICHASCFDDMEVCYGCLHRFTADDERSAWADRMRESVPKVLEGACAKTTSVRAERGRGGPTAPIGVEATIQPSRGRHGAMVIRIEIPASALPGRDAEATAGARSQ